jgi:uncharacterized membrane protein YdjX (TVP38/TMEM64 family)
MCRFVGTLGGIFMRDADRYSATEPRRRKVTGGFGGFGILAVLALGLAVFLVPAKDLLQQGEAIKAQLAGFGLAAPLVYTLAAAGLTAAGAPRLLLCSVAGMAFGTVWGLVWSQLGTLLGAYGTFLTVRWCGREPILRRFPRLARFTGKVEGRGLLAVLLTRQLPINGFYNNLLLGIAPVGHADFLIGSLLGFLPLGATAVLIGAGAVQADLSRIVQYSAAGLATFAVLGFLLNGFIQSARTAAKFRTPPVSVHDGVE